MSEHTTGQAPADAHLREDRLSREELLRGKFLHVARDTVRLPSGAEASREFVLHPGAVMIVPMLPNGRVVLERQYRYPMGEVMVEFPAGKLDAGEGSLNCARRELREETGYDAGQWAYAGRLAPTIAYSDEIIDIWFARNLTLGERQLDDGEFLDVIDMAHEELMAACRTGAVYDSKTLVAALWLEQVRTGAWSLDWSGQVTPGHERSR
ncbi:NUDIX hydrolase [Hydrogenophaga sp. 5NK40-0174]|uniref:NUDIX hydrolase n=1 Tax=Hydrogenophaga sp. 5NK40-0174 TaxID=3127649 RepID=UPI00310AC01C